MNRDQMELASASTSSAAPAAKRRGPVAALIAAVIVAAALLFAMPSLAYASNEASGSPQGADSQEILLSKPDSSKSVSKTPDEPKTPPAYTPQDAYKSTPQSTGSGVDLVNGAGDSSNTSYTPGDAKSSINDKDSNSDSDSASDPSNNGTEDKDDSTQNKGDGTSDTKTDNDSTGNNNGAISDVTDEIATDKNQSAHPTGDNSKADDVIATPGDKGSADLTAGATSVKTEEVKQQTTISNSTAMSSQANITTQASAQVKIVFGKGLTATEANNLKVSGTSYDFETVNKDIIHVWGQSSDPIFDSTGKRLYYNSKYITSGDTITINASEAAGLNINQLVKRYAYSGTQWLFIIKQEATLPNGNTRVQWKKAIGTFSSNLMDSSFNAGQYTSITAYAVHTPAPTTVLLYHNGVSASIGKPEFEFGETIDLSSFSASGATHGHSANNNKLVWYVMKDINDVNDAIAKKDYYTDLDFDKGVTVGDLVDRLFNFRGTANQTTNLGDITGLTQMGVSLVLAERELADENAITVTYDGNKPSSAAASVNVEGVPANDSGSKDGNTPFKISSDEPTLAGYKFNGWNTAANGGGTAYAAGATIPGNLITGNIMLYAQWIQQLSITFNGNASSGVTGLPSTVTVDYNAATSIPTTTPTRTNFTFKNWNTEADGSGDTYTPGQNIANLTANLPLYAQWTAYPVVTYNANGGTGGPTEGPVAPGTYIVKEGTPTRANYVFGGWTQTQNPSNPATAAIYAFRDSNGDLTIEGATGNSFNVTSDVTLYALWNPIVTYSAGTAPAGAKDSITNMPSTTTYTITYNGNHTVLTTPIPTVTGYTFGGWARNTAPTTAVTTLTNVTAPVTLIPIWNENSNYTVQFFDQATGTSDGAACSSQENLKWTGTITLPGVPTKTGYTFGGWFLQKDGNGSGTGTAFSNAGGTTINSGLSAFNGLWASYPTGTRGNTLKIYAKWTEKAKVSVTLNPNGGSYGTAGTGVTTIPNILNGGSYTIPTNVDNPTRPQADGYNFKEWNTNPTGTGTKYVAGNTISNITTNITLYAIWTGAPVTFTFVKSPATGVTTLKGDPYTTTATYGSNLSADKGNDVYTRESYTFRNWSYNKAAGGTGTVSSATAAGTVAVADFAITWSGNPFDGTLKGTAILEPIWDPFTFRISWNGNGGSPTTTTSGVASAKVEIPTAASAIPTRPGYTFTGHWNTQADGKGIEVDNSKTIENTWNLAGLANNATLNAYAQWKENIVQLTFVGHTDKMQGITANVVYNDNNAAVPSTIYVGAKTGDIYSSATATTPTAFNISRKVKPSIVNPNFEFLKWQKDGVDLSSVNWTSAGVLTVPTNAQGLYENATYSLIMGPKQYGYTVEYYLQDVAGSGYTIDNTQTVTSGRAPFGYRVESGTSASIDDAYQLVTFVRKTITGFTYNSGRTGTEGAIVSMSANASANVIKLYYSRNSNNLTVTFAGSVPSGAGTPGVNPSTGSVRYGTEVTLTTPTAPTGYIFDGWTIASGSLQSGESLTIPSGGNATFHMPNGALTIRGNWVKETYTVLFKLSNGADGTNVGNLSGTTTFNPSYGDTIATAPTASPKDSSKYYFIGWNVYKNCTGTNESTGTLVGTLSNADINGTYVIDSNTVFVGRFGELIAVSYVPGANGGFTEVNGNMLGGTVTNAGTVYENLQATWHLPGFAYGDGKVNVSSFEDPNGGRNLGPTGSGNPKAKPGYKFVGWSWKGANGTTYQNTGYYNNYQFVKTAGNDMPEFADSSYIFTALWEKTWQQVHYSDQCVNISGLTGTGATDAKYQVGDRVTLPTAPTYHDTANKGAYTFAGWTTVSTGYVHGSSPLYTNAAGHSFTMTAGVRDVDLYNGFAEVRADGSYGVTLYPVFIENNATINYTFATGCGSMGTIAGGPDTIGMATGTPAGATATASKGHVFRGWFKDAAHTQAVDGAWLSGTDSNVIKPQQEDGIFAAGTTTYYALFEIEEYTVQFNVGDTTMGGWADGSSSVTKQTANPIPYNTALGAANVPGTKGKTGYGFAGWNTKADGTGTSYPDISGVKITEPNMIFYAMWEPRDGYTIHYNPDGGSLTTVTQTTIPGGAKLKWTDVLNDVMLSDAKNMKKLGYTFDGWYIASDFSGSRIDVAGSSTTFGQAVMTQQPGTSEDDIPTLELYAKWIAKDFTVKYNAQLPTGSLTIGDKNPVHWDSTNLRPAGNEDLTFDGYDFLGWNTKADGSGLTVSDATVFSTAYQNVNGTTSDAATTLTLFGIWKEKAFSVVFRGAGADIRVDGLKWNDTVTYRNPVTPNTAQYLAGWTYTPAGSTQQTWNGTPNALSVATIAGDADAAAAGAVFYLDAILRDNAIWTINYNKVNVDAAGAPNPAAVTKVGTEDGYIQPGTAIDIHNFNGKNYVKTFNDANASTTLKGYKLDETVLDSKLTATVIEVVDGANIVFNVYWVEKVFNFEYDLGVDGQGNAAPSTLTPPAPRQAAWTQAVPQPTWPGDVPNWDGHKDPKWQYKSGSNWVDVPAGATVSTIAANDDNTNPIVLRLLWATDQARITYAAQDGGTITGTKGNGNTINIPARGSDFEDVSATSGPVGTVTAKEADGYKFDGWFKDGTLVTSSKKLTVTKNPATGLFENSTYTAHFSKLGDIAYTIEHYFQQADGSYSINAGLTDSASGQEGSRVDKTAAMEKTVKGYAYQAGITGEKLYIAALTPGSADNVIRLYYILKDHVVDVAGMAPGADAPVSVPAPTYETTGITAAHTTGHKFGTTLVLPTMPSVAGWNFSWTLTYTEPGEAAVTRTGLSNGATFTMPDADVSIFGVWTRMPHEVIFTAGSDPHGTVSVKAPATAPFYVEHGKKMTDPSSTGNYGLIQYTEDTGWALVGWRYLDENGVTRDASADLTASDGPNNVVINANTVFTAIWAQTFFVAYDPGAGTNNHGGTGFTTLQRGGSDIGIGVNVNTLPLLIGGTDRTKDAPAAPGYRFIGWTWNNGGNFYWITDAAAAAGYDTTGLGTAGELDFTVERNITFTAIWEALEQTLTYKIDGDNSPASNWTAGGKPGQAGLTTEDYAVTPKPRTDQVVTLLDGTDVERAGYTLAGWKYTDADGVEHTITGSFTMPAYNVTLTPVWDFAGLKIYFDYANGCDNTYGQLDKFSVPVNDATVMHIDGATATANTGYKFMGWYTDVDHTNKITDPFQLAGANGEQFIGDGTNGWVSKTYYAWFDASETSYTIEFNLQTLTGFDTFTRNFTGVMTGSTVDTETAGNKAYTDRLSVEAEDIFKNYVFDPTHTGSELIKVVMADGTTKLVVFYNMLPFDITYDKDLPDAAYTWDWVSTVGPDKGTADTTITIPAAKRDGFQFNGWTITYVDPITGATVNTDLAANTFTMPMANVLVTAKWAQFMDVVIEYYKRGEVDPLGTETDHAVEDTNYTCTLDRIAAFKAAHAADLNGYRYIDDGNRTIVITSDPRHNVIQIFFDLINDFGVQFDKNYGDNRIIGKVDGLTLADMPYGNKPADPTRAGYVLDADKTWNTKADGTGLQLKLTTTLDELLKAVYGDNYSADDFLAQGGILTLYAIWNENDQYQVIYDLNNMKEKNPNILNDMPEWREDMAAEDKHGALWNQAGFNFKPIDKELSAPHGYEFVGWNTQADGKGHTITDATKYFEMSNWIDPNVEQMSITLYAMWKEIELDIKYLHTVGGTVDRELDRISAVSGQHVQTGSSPIDPTPKLHSVATPEAGYHFVGWEIYDEEKHAGLLRAMADGDALGNLLRYLRNHNEEIVVDPNDGRYYGARYIAIFEKNADATITYDGNGAELGEIDPVTLSHGLSTKLHNGVYVATTGKGYKRSYYTLVGWNTKEDGTGDTYRLGQGLVMPEGGLHLYAMWEINSYPVHVGDRGDDVADVKGGKTDVVYGEKLSPEFISKISQTPKKGSTFKGWHVTMTDGETGEVIYDQIVWDLSEVPEIMGPVEITAEYETVPVEDMVTEGTTLPKTGDEGLLGWILALVAGLAVALIVLFARRRQDDDDDDDHTNGTPRARRDQVVAGAGRTAAGFAACTAGAVEAANAAAYASRMTNMVNVAGSRFEATFCSEATKMFTLRMRNGRTRNTDHANGIARTAFVALVLVGALVFAPGIALATTGDPGAGDSASISSHTQTTQSNADPAKSQTGSFQSKASKAASSSAGSASKASVSASSSSAGAKSSMNLSSAPSSATNSTCRASQNASAASSAGSAAASESVSGSNSTRIAASDKITRLSYLNALAHKQSSCSTNAGRAAGSAGTVTVSSAVPGASYGNTSASGAFSGVSGTSYGATSALTMSYSAGTSGAGVLHVTSLSGEVGAADTPGAVCTSIINSSHATQGSAGLSGFATGAGAMMLCSGSFAGTTYANASAASLDPGGGGVSSASDPPTSGIISATDPPGDLLAQNNEVYAITTRFYAEDGADPEETPGETDDSTIIHPDDPSDDPSGEVTDGPVKLTYSANEGGSVSYASDKICSSTGTKLDENGKPTDKDVTGPVATPKTGYHFVGWAIEDPNAGDDVQFVTISDKAALDAKTVKDCALSKKTNCYKATNFISLFERNDYQLDYDANGGKLGDGNAAPTPTLTTYGSNEEFASSTFPAREGYKFLCWNTDAAGKGAALREGETLSFDKMRGVVIGSPVEDENGASIRLYAQWLPTEEKPILIGPVVPENPVRPTTPVIPVVPVSPGNSSSSPDLSNGASSSGITAGQAAFAQASGPEEVQDLTAFTEVQEVALPNMGQFASLIGGVAALSEALTFPPVLEVLPEAATQFVTVSTEALSGVRGASDKISASVSTGAMQSAAIAVTAAGAIAIAFGVANVASSAATRRRVLSVANAQAASGSASGSPDPASEAVPEAGADIATGSAEQLK